MSNATLVVPAEEKSVLIISAHAHLRIHYAEVLKALNIRTEAVADGFEALAFLRTHPVYAVLSDFFLPALNAVELFLFMKELHLAVPFVICSRDLNAKMREEARLIGVSRIVRKPTEKREIIAGIADAVEERENRLLRFYC